MAELTPKRDALGRTTAERRAMLQALVDCGKLSPDIAARIEMKEPAEEVLDAARAIAIRLRTEAANITAA